MHCLPLQAAPDLQQLAGSQVCIWGIGSHGGGLAAARLCAHYGAHVALLDAQPGPHNDTAAEHGWPLAQGHVEHPWLRQMDWVVVSPAIPPAVLAQLPRNHAPLISAEGLCLAQHSQTRIMVTGTKGKSSTAAMLGALLGWPVVGNSWTPMAAAMLDQPETPWICECSSFQLAQLARQQPRFSSAILTSLDRDHLDWHGNLEAYHQSKIQGLSWARNVAAPDGLQPRLREAGLAAALLSLVRLTDERFLYGDICVARRDDLPLLGAHHGSNACLALSVALHHGLDGAESASRLRTTPQLPHRLQIIYRDQHYTAVDDSTATTPLATRAAVASIPGPLALILGGRDKGGDFSALYEDLQQRPALYCLLIGESAEGMARDCMRLNLAHRHCPDLATAVQQGLAWIGQQAQPGTLLLAPACASLGSFQDFADRGRQFAHWVRHSLA